MIQALALAQMRNLWTENGAGLPEAHHKMEQGRCQSKMGVLIGKRKGEMDVGTDY